MGHPQKAYTQREERSHVKSGQIWTWGRVDVHKLYYYTNLPGNMAQKWASHPHFTVYEHGTIGIYMFYLLIYF